MKISVVTPVYNRQDCIGKCMSSVASQQGYTCELEHVIVDDGSSDASFEQIQQFAASHKNVKALRLSRNQGPNAARNAAIAAADGDYVMLLDSDDHMLPGAIAFVEKTIAGHPGFNYFLFAYDDDERIYGAYGNEHVFTFEDFVSGSVVHDFVHVIPRKMLVEYPFGNELRIYEGLFLKRIYRRCRQLFFTNRAICHVDRGRADHVSVMVHKTNRKAIETYCAAMDLLYRWFADDYCRTGAGRGKLSDILVQCYKCHVLLSDYAAAKTDMSRLRAIGAASMPPAAYRLVAALHLGAPAWFAARNLLKLKHALKR